MSSLLKTLLCALTLGIGFSMAALAPGYLNFSAALVVGGGACMTFVVATNGLMQLSTESAMRGRVMALRVGVALGATPIGAPTVGWVADRFGPRWALAVGAASGFAAVIVALYSIRRQDLGQAGAQSAARQESSRPFT